jgi:cell division protein FtsL
MSEPTTPTATPKPGPPEPKPADASQGKPDASTDWEAKFTGQQQVNRDLEQKLNDIRDQQKAQTDAIAKAFGIAPEETSDVSALTSQVTSLQEQFAKTTHTNTVLAVANEHGISDKDDLALLMDAKDEQAVRRLAERIAKAGESTPHTPKPDLTQGGKGGSGKDGSPEQQFADFIGNQLGR